MNGVGHNYVHYSKIPILYLLGGSHNWDSPIGCAYGTLQPI